ncbi:MAG: glycosyltransferase family 4 protein [Candidatus Aenigmarchaeota archaeon]|nr:glycosyltransferase family 4 protein [Candidatus Aenigmarchaeota archaeon]
MRILFITPFNLFPPYWGGGVRTYNLIKYLAKKHDIYLIFPSYEQLKNKDSKRYRNELEKLNVKIFIIKPLINLLKRPIIEHLNPFFFFRCLDIIISEKIDLILCDYPWSGTYVFGLYFLTRKPFILIEHNIEYLVKKQIKAKFVRLMKIIELLLCKHAKKITVVCNKDKQKLFELGIDKRKIFVIENGFDEQTFYPSQKYNEKIRKELDIGKDPLMLFCGKLDYPPNKEAVYIIRWEILPKVLEKIPNSKFLVVGGGYEFEIKHDSLIFTGIVDNIERYINASDVVINPLLKGGGTRIKVLEAIACGKTVISTKKGVEGLTNKLTRPFLKLADDWDDFSNLIVESIKSSSHRKVPKEFVKKYSWQNTYRKMDEILKQSI